MNNLNRAIFLGIGIFIGFSTLPAIRSFKYGVNSYIQKSAAQRQAELQKLVEADRAKTEAAKPPESIQKTSQIIPTQKGPTPLWVVTDGKCLLVSKFEPRAVRLSDGWVVEFGNEASALPAAAPTPRKKSRKAKAE